MASPIPTKLDPKLVAHLDELVAEGLYISRSEAIREGVRRLVAESYLSANGFRQVVAEISANLLVERLRGKLTDIILFGSTARGTSTPESDVDLLLLFRGNPTPQTRHSAHEAVYPVSLYSGQAISLIVLSRQAFTRLLEMQSRFALEVVKYGKQLHGRFLQDVRRN